MSGCERADLDRRAHALVVVGRRHADVDDREVGLVLGDDGEQRLGVADAARRPRGPASSSRPARPSRSSTVSSAITTRTAAPPRSRVPPPGGLSIASVPPCAATRSRMPASPEPRRTTAPPTPSSATRHEQRAVLARPPARATRDGERVLDRVRERLAGDEVGGRLDARGDALAGRLDVDRDGSARARGRAARRRARRRAAPAGRRRRSGAGRRSPRRPRRRSGRARARGSAPRAAAERWSRRSCDAERDEPLLRAVVQVALEPAALLVAGLDDPRARRLDLGELQPHLDAQPRDLDRERGRGEDAVEQVAAARAARVVEQHGGARRRRARISRRARPSSRQARRGARRSRRRTPRLAAARRRARRAGRGAPRRATGRSPPARRGRRAPRPRRRAPAARPRTARGEAPVDESLDPRAQRPERERHGERRAAATTHVEPPPDDDAEPERDAA